MEKNDKQNFLFVNEKIGNDCTGQLSLHQPSLVTFDRAADHRGEGTRYAAGCDINEDGHLDLFIAGYLCAYATWQFYCVLSSPYVRWGSILCIGRLAATVESDDCQSRPRVARVHESVMACVRDASVTRVPRQARTTS
jgi:hypothetical protein